MSTYTPIASITLGSAQSSVTFSNIPQTYTDLRLIINASATSGSANTDLRFNNDTGSNYSTTYLTGTGTAASSGRASNDTEILVNYYGYLDTVAGATNYVIDIQNYSNTTTNKTLLSRSNNAANGTAAVVGLWRSTAAINRIDILIDASTFTSGSTFNLYGIANASITNTAKATGGDSVTTDGTYWYHTFRSSGIFTPTQALTADYLVVAGGGGGGGYSSKNGGGGAGGLRCTVGATGGGGSLESAIALTNATAYAITVGAGGVGMTSNSQLASVGNGSNSSISGTGLSTITSTGGGGGGNSSDTSANRAGANGGSGGGGAVAQTVAGLGAGGSGTANQGFAGGNAAEDLYVWASSGGGGGAGQAGYNGSQTASTASDGGNGVTTSISGTSTTYAGGGGGNGIAVTHTVGQGGLGGGGAGATSGTGTAGTANTGGGGGAAPTGGAGGSGIVIIRYAV